MEIVPIALPFSGHQRHFQVQIYVFLALPAGPGIVFSYYKLGLRFIYDEFYSFFFLLLSLLLIILYIFLLYVVGGGGYRYDDVDLKMGQ